jgi:ABC-2 type transport system permease protein
MSYFFDLVLNEKIKIYKRPRGLILLALVVVMNLCAAVIMKYIFNDTNFTFWDHLNISTYLIFVLNFICLIIAGDIVSSEFSTGTIKMLLIRPANRLKILFAKYVAVILFVAVVIIVHLVTSIIFGAAFFYSNILILEGSIQLKIIANYLFGFIEVVIICSFAMMLSVVTRSSVFSVSVPIFLIMSFKLILELMSHYNVQQGKYFLFANSNLSQHFFGQTVFEGMTLNFSLVNIALHMLFFFTISAIIIFKRDVNV